MLFTRKPAIRLVIIALLSIFSCVSVIAYNLLSSPDRAQLVDNSASEKLSFFALGDQGTGKLSQWKIARSMENVAEQNHGINFVVFLGDNFYSKGVQSTHDEQWNYKFENVYSGGNLKKIPFYAVLGNHDARHNPEMEIRYSQEKSGSGRWQMPGHHYSVDFGTDHGHPLLRIVFIDTNLLKDDLKREVDFVKQSFSQTGSQPTWRLVVGHHPIRNFGKHGETAQLVSELLPVLKQYQVDFYLAGHDHDEQVIAQDGEPYYLICGGGGQDLYHVPAPHDGLLYSDSDYSFIKMDVESTDMTITYYDADAKAKVTYSLKRNCEGAASVCLQEAKTP